MATDRVHLLGRAALLALTLAACGTAPVPSPSPSLTSVTASAPAPAFTAPAPLRQDDVLARLRTLDSSLALVPTTRPDDSDAFPDLAFDAVPAAAPGDVAPRIGLVLVYPTTSEREAMQPFFGPNGMSGPGPSVTIDGIVHSEWIGIDNVLVEVVMPGGTMGGRSPTPAESTYPELVRDALAGTGIVHSE